MLKLLHRLNLTQSFFLFVLVSSVIPVLLVGITAYHFSTSLLIREVEQFNATLVSDQKDYMNLSMKQVEDLMVNIAGVNEILQALAQEDVQADDYTFLSTQARISYILDSYTIDNLVSIDIFTLNGVHYHVGDTLDVSNIREDLIDELFLRTSASNKQVYWYGIGENVNTKSGYPQVITAGKIINRRNADTGAPEPLALLLVNMNVDSLYEQLNSVDLGQHSYLMVIDQKDWVVYHPDRSKIASTVNPEILAQLTGNSGLARYNDSRQEWLVAYNRIETNNWLVVGFFPVGAIMARTTMISLAATIAMVVAFVFMLLGAIFISQRIVRPIQQITAEFIRLQEGDGVERPLQLKGIGEVDDLVKWYNTYIQNLIAERQAKDALEESEERYALALQGANDGIWDWDLRKNKVYYSARWKAMLGYSEEEIGETINEWILLIHPDDAERVRHEIAAHLEGSTPYFESEYRIFHKSGRYRWMMARGLAVHGDGKIPHRMAGSQTDITARKVTEEQLRHDVMHDSLTNLPNRAYFLDQVKRAIERAHRRDGMAAVLFMDLDRFKIVNDSLGHVCGDRMLLEIGQRLGKCIRGEDTVARFGGDEFAILLDYISSIQDAIRVAERVQAEIAEPYLIEGQELFTSVSIGIALVTPNYASPDDLLRDADTAMYRAKSTGRARYQIFDQEMHTRSLAVLQLESELRRAVERNEFELHYQPIVSLQSRKVECVEALLRWRHPQRGLVYPVDFMQMAEETGLINPIGKWALREACRQVNAWHTAGYARMAVSVNISVRQFQEQNLPELVADCLREFALDGSALQLEITESATMADVNSSLQIVERLSRLGVRISIDDFGTSYSSLGYLKRFPVSQIKIDRSFIQDIQRDDSAAIVTAITAIGHILNLQIVAEGVETQDQLNFLRDQHCHFVQGFYFDAAMPAEEVEKQFKVLYSLVEPAEFAAQ